MRNITFEFNIGDTVTLKDIERKGTVTGLLVDNDGKQYRVVYWDNSTRKCDWVFPFEISNS